MADVKDEEVQLREVKDAWLQELFRGALAREGCFYLFFAVVVGNQT